MIVMRVIPFTLPTFESLSLPASVQQLAEAERGLVLVTGVSGSGKSSTVAAMVHHINQNYQRHIVIIEDPIEFLHRDLNSSITQREVGVDTDNAEVGLRAALRQDPDVVVLGDLRDASAVNHAIKAAETGRLVIAVVPTPNVVATVGQVLTLLPQDEREIGRIRFAEAMRGIVAQQLVPRADGAGRVPVVEALINTPVVREAIRESRLGELARLLALDNDMSSFSRHAQALVDSGTITKETAKMVQGDSSAAPSGGGGGGKRRKGD
jgi:twitching motility protein PilT